MNKQTEGHENRSADRWKDRQTDGQMKGETNRGTDDKQKEGCWNE